MSSPDYAPITRTELIRALKLAMLEIAEGDAWGATVTLMNLQIALCEDYALAERHELVKEHGEHVAMQ